MIKTGKGQLKTNPNEDEETLDLIESISTFYNFESVNPQEYVCMLFDLMYTVTLSYLRKYFNFF